MKPETIIIGKRIAFGQVVMSLVTVAAFVWDSMNPDNKLPASVVSALSQVAVGIGQFIVVNWFGVTTGKEQ